MALLPFIQRMEQRDPQFFASMKNLQELALGEGMLDMKTKLLISLALDACLGSKHGVASVSQKLRQLGAREEEIAETLRLAYFAAGNRLLDTFTAVDESRD